MLSSKSNVYRGEWLELVFANRNKLYGAYELRQSYSSRLSKALLLAVALFAGSITGIFLYNNLKKAMAGNEHTLALPDKVITVALPAKLVKEKPAAARPQKAEPVKTQTKKFVVPKTVPAAQVTEEMPDVQELKNANIGQQDSKGTPAEVGTSPVETAGGNGSGTGTGTAEGTTTNEPFIYVEHMPEFPGGLEAFGRYLNKNLHYPAAARENGIQGRVVVSFVVEKNGQLSAITVVKGIGSGCDEEAVRVLKKAPAWKPGIQNGQPVRVQYTVPITFQLGE